MLKPKTKSRRLRIVVSVIASVGTVAVAIPFVGLWIWCRDSEVDTTIRSVLADTERQRAERVAAVERARSVLPSESALPRDWSLDAYVRMNLTDEAIEDLETRREVFWCLLDERKPPEAKVHTAKCPEPHLTRLQKRIDDAREARRITSLEESLDLRRCGRGEVLAGIERYFIGSPVLREAETAYERGLFLVPELARDDAGTLRRYFALAGAVEFRAVCQAMQGDVDGALGSYRDARGMYSLILQANEVTAYEGVLRPGLRSLEHIVEAAWARAPLTAEQRALLLELPNPMPRERLSVMLYACAKGDQEENAQERARCESRRFGFLYGLAYRYLEARERRHKRGSLPQLASLLAQPPYEVRSEYERLDRGGDGLGRAKVGSFVGRVRRYHGESAMLDTFPEMLRAVFALKDYRRERGRYPENLEGLVPGTIPPLPREPWLGLPLGYRTDGKGFTISLAWRTGEDTRGRNRPEGGARYILVAEGGAIPDPTSRYSELAWSAEQ